jgi:cytochrome c oxidase subunit 1
MMRIGLLGMRRRIGDYDPALGFDATHLVLTIAAYLIATSVIIFLYNFFHSMKNGEVAEGNIWNSRSPEWQVPSPMPVHNYDQPFEVVGEPYDYGLEGSKFVEFAKSKKDN